MILDFIAIAAVTMIVTNSKIFQPVREFASKKSMYIGDLLSCALCTGFWVGGLIFFCPLSLRPFVHYISIGSLSSEVVYLLIKRLRVR